MTPLTASGLQALVCSRRSTRAFRNDPVPRDLLRQLLEIAARSPSTFNTQPWQLHVITGSALKKLSQRILDAHTQGLHPQFSPFPDPPVDECAARQGQFGQTYYAALGFARDDQAARARQTARNYAFFGAPAGVMVTIDSRLTRNSWLDLGLFLQTFMLAANELGLASCPQVAFLRYEKVIAQSLGFKEYEALACGLSLGYADEQAAVNQMNLPRLGLEEFVRWHAD